MLCRVNRFYRSLLEQFFEMEMKNEIWKFSYFSSNLSWKLKNYLSLNCIENWFNGKYFSEKIWNNWEKVIPKTKFLENCVLFCHGLHIQGFQLQENSHSTFKDLNSFTIISPHLNDMTDFIPLEFCNGQPQYFLSSSVDNTIQYWDTKSGVCQQSFLGHSDLVQSLALHKNLLCSASFDTTLKLWNFSSGLCQKTYNIGERIWCLQMNPSTAVIGIKGPENFLATIDLGSESPPTFHQVGHRGPVYGVEIESNGIITSCSFDGSIKKIDPRIKTPCVLTLEDPDDYPLYCLQSSLDQNLLCVGTAFYSTVRFWDLRYAHYLYSILVEPPRRESKCSIIYTLSGDNTLLFAGLSNGLYKVNFLSN